MISSIHVIIWQYARSGRCEKEPQWVGHTDGVVGLYFQGSRPLSSPVCVLSCAADRKHECSRGPVTTLLMRDACCALRHTTWTPMQSTLVGTSWALTQHQATLCCPNALSCIACSQLSLRTWPTAMHARHQLFSGSLNFPCKVAW